MTDSKPGIINSIEYALHAMNKPIPADIDAMLGPPLWRSFVEVCGVKEDMADEAVAKYREYYNDKGMLENTLYDGISQLLIKLQKRNIKIALATSKPEFYAKQILEHFDISQYFDFIAGSEMDGTRSNKAEVISYALQNFNDCLPVMIGDRKHDIIGARASNIDSVGVLWGYGSEKELQDAKPTAIVATMQQLYDLIISS